LNGNFLLIKVFIKRKKNGEETPYFQMKEKVLKNRKEKGREEWS
jgi:hypothetical protein